MRSAAGISNRAAGPAGVAPAVLDVAGAVAVEYMVTPNRLPDGSIARATGSAPAVPSNVWMTLSAPVAADTSKTVPTSVGPPWGSRPYRFPAASTTSPVGWVLTNVNDRAGNGATTDTAANSRRGSSGPTAADDGRARRGDGWRGGRHAWAIPPRVESSADPHGPSRTADIVAGRR